MTAADIIGIYLLTVNLVTFLLFGFDKHRALRHKWRVPEATLLVYAFFGGCIGALLGMALFHHKTRKWKFRILVPVSLLLWAGLAAEGLRLALA